MRIAVAVLFLLVPAPAVAQTWAELKTVPRATSVRVYEMGGKGWSFVDGKLLLVRDNELTILKSGKPLVIPRPSISHIERKRDTPAEGALIGTLIGVLAYTAGAGQEGCEVSRTVCIVGTTSYFTVVGALIDWGITKKRKVYRAP